MAALSTKNSAHAQTDAVISPVPGWAVFMARMICSAPGYIIIVGLLLAGIGAVLASHIQIRSSFVHLLPENDDAVRDLQRINERIEGTGTLVIHLEGHSSQDLPQMQRFADALATHLRAFPKNEVRYVEYKVDAALDFYKKNKALFVGETDLEYILHHIRQEIMKRKQQANPFFVSLDAVPLGSAKTSQDLLRPYLQKFEQKVTTLNQYQSGYLTNPSGTALLIVVKTPGDSTNVKFATRFVTKVRQTISRLSPQSFSPNISVHLSGELKRLPEEYQAIKEDILVVSNSCILLVVIAVSFFFRSFKLTAILASGLVTALCTTFGIVYLHIGYLTAATAFLSAIVAGNGVNFGLYILARYLEEKSSHSTTAGAWAATFSSALPVVSIAALAAAVSYSSLLFTQFRGFNQFGFIGGLGMVICLIYALFFIPALVVAIERLWPISPKTLSSFRQKRSIAGALAPVLMQHPKKILFSGIAALLGACVAIWSVGQDPFEYDFRKLGNRDEATPAESSRDNQTGQILKRRSSAHVILVDELSQVSELKSRLLEYGDAHPNLSRRAVKRVRTIFDYLPGTGAEQKRKIALIKEMQRLLKKYHNFLTTDEQQQANSLLPSSPLHPITIGDLPVTLARPFTEKNGNRGTLVLVDARGSVWQKSTITRFSRVVRKIKLQNGDIIRSSGKLVIFNDLIQHVIDDGPSATLLAYSAVLILLALWFRTPIQFLIVAGAMTTGVVLMLGVAAMAQQKLNFLNFVAIPIQFGIGVDYSIHLFQRIHNEGIKNLETILRYTGGAVLITSTTTIIGYGAMWFSRNGAINTMGTLANIGEFTCLFVAIVLLPTVLIIIKRQADTN